jgi:ribosomal protein S18 acetylase RimI-like enzyme
MTSHTYGAVRLTDTGHHPALRDAELLQRAIRKSISTSPEAFLKTIDDVDNKSIDYWEKEIDSSTWVVIQRGREVVGIAVSRSDYEMHSDIDPAETRFIESVWINPKLRRRGMGERLVRYLLEMECERYADVKQFLLWVFKENDRAIQLYTRIGFEYRQQQPVMSGRTELKVEYLMSLETTAMVTDAGASQAGRQDDLRQYGVAYRLLGVTA